MTGVAYICSKSKAVVAWNFEEELNHSTSKIVKITSDIKNVCCIDGQYLGIMTVNHDLHVYDLSQEIVVASVNHMKIVNFCAKSGTVLILVTSDMKVFRYDFRTSELVNVFSVNFEITVIHASECIWIGTVEGNVLQYSYVGDRMYSDITHQR